MKDSNCLPKSEVPTKRVLKEYGPGGPAITKRRGIQDHVALSCNSHRYLGRGQARLSDGPMQIGTNCFENREYVNVGDICHSLVPGGFLS